jgi:hypothetical protein
MHCSIYKGAWYYVVLFIKRLDIMLSEFCPDIRPGADIAVALWCLHMGKIDVITYKYVTSPFINRTMHAFFHIRTVIIPQPISITHSLVCVCVKLILFFLIQCWNTFVCAAQGLISLWHFGVYIWAKLTLLLINMW